MAATFVTSRTAFALLTLTLAAGFMFIQANPATAAEKRPSLIITSEPEPVAPKSEIGSIFDEDGAFSPAHVPVYVPEPTPVLRDTPPKPRAPEAASDKNSNVYPQAALPPSDSAYPRPEAPASTGTNVYPYPRPSKTPATAPVAVPASEESAYTSATPVAVPSLKAPARPLVKIRFDQPNVDFVKSVYDAVTAAKKRYPDARFNLVAVYPSKGNAAEVTIESTRARRNAEAVLRSLQKQGVDVANFDLSTLQSADVKSNEVHILIR